MFPQVLFELPTAGNVASSLDAILTERFPDPAERARQVQDLIARQGLPSSLPDGVNIFSESPNVVTSYSGSLALIGVRNTLALTLYYVKTITLPDAALPPTFIDFNNNVQKGVSLSLSHRLRQGDVAECDCELVRNAWGRSRHTHRYRSEHYPDSGYPPTDAS